MARLGEILVKAGVLEESVLRRALRLQQRLGEPLGRVLVQNAWLSEPMLVRALSAQLQLPSVVIDQVDIPPPLLRLLPLDYVRRLRILPFHIDARVLHVAIANPPNQRLADELRVKLRMDIRFHIAGPAGLERAFGRYFPEPVQSRA